MDFEGIKEFCVDRRTQDKNINIASLKSVEGIIRNQQKGQAGGVRKHLGKVSDLMMMAVPRQWRESLIVNKEDPPKY